MMLRDENNTYENPFTASQNIKETKKVMENNVKKVKENTKKIEKMENKGEDLRQNTGEFLELTKQLNN
jgi:uncharacterized protein Yka (UPF0111/DUF47 family)